MKLNPSKTYLGFRTYRGQGIMPAKMLTKSRIPNSFEIVTIFTSKKEATDWLYANPRRKKRG